METKHTSAIEQFVIDKIKEMRKAQGISQRVLENRADFSNGFIGKVESKNHRAKYNLNHINIIAKVLGCKIWDLLPEKPVESQK